MFTAIATVLYLPLAIGAIIVTGYRPPAPDAIFLLGTGALQTLYFVILRRGYAVGDLSVVYPLARGTGPLVAMIIAVLLLSESPTFLTICGALVISCGTLVLAAPHTWSARVQRGAQYGLLTGCIIGCYTAWDGYAVGSLGVPALLLGWAGDAGRAILLTPIAMRRRHTLRDLWTNHRTGILAVAILSTASYVMVLTAMSIAPISSIAPAREISIVVGSILGITLLGEPGGPRRLLSAGVITVGVALVALG